MSIGRMKDQATGGTGLLAILCDMDPQWHEEFRAWLAEDMFPRRKAIGFLGAASYDLMPDDPPFLAQALPFLTVYQTASVGDLYGAPYQGLRANRDARDKAFHARFLRPARYILNWAGPETVGTEFDAPDNGLAPVVVMDRFDLAAHDVEGFNTWFVGTYLPACSALPDLVRVRRYMAMEGGPAHVLVHELAGPAGLGTREWLALRQEAAWHVTGNRHSAAYRRVLVG